MRHTNHNLTFLFVVLTGLLCARDARADGHFGPSDYSPSVLTYAFDGFWAGALVGTAGGYLYARRDGFERGDWRPIIIGTGVGALSGIGAGLTLGFIDLAAERPGVGGIVLRDMYAGSSLGLLAGVIGGALAVAKTKEPEHIGFGGAIGTLAGAGIGALIGFIEGPRIVNSPQHRYPGARMWPTFALLSDGHGGRYVSSGLRGSF